MSTAEKLIGRTALFVRVAWLSTVYCLLVQPRMEENKYCLNGRIRMRRPESPFQELKSGMALVDILELPEVSFTLGLGAIRLPEDGVRLS
ncbi:hypothetical protein DW877_12430 [[Clostridium] symbiosum]|nr:hypothetical protein DW877_12430 [[Clostridium] symbiosum]